MKLIYLFIDDFAPFKKTGMNFVADYKCSFDNGKLSVVRQNVLPDNFFSKGNSAELFVSAIVGPNGSGKTSLIRFLEAVHYFPERAGKFVMLIEAKGKLRVYYNLNDNRLQIEHGHCTIEDCHVVDIVRDKGNDCDALNTCFHTIYYSPYYSHTSPVNYPSSKDESDAYFTSISTTTKLNEASQRLEGLSLSPDVIYRAEEIKREIRFYREAKIDLPHPESILLRPQDWRLQEIVGIFLRLIQEEKGKRERMALEGTRPRLRLNDGELDRLEQMYAFLVSRSEDAFIELFKCMTAIAWYKNSVYRDTNFNRKMTGHEPLTLHGHVIELRSDDNAFGRRLYEFATRNDELNESTPLTRETIVEELRAVKCSDVFDFDLPLSNGETRRIDSPLGEFFARASKCENIKNDSGTHSLRVSSIAEASDVLDLVEIYKSCETLGDFAEFDFDPPFSAGEQTLVSLYSRLWELFEDRRSLEADYCGEDFSKFYAGARESGWLIVLDEAEVTLHPDWQRTLINNLLKTFNTSFPGFNVHFIFATHSPILLSDIPQGNVVFLKKEGSEAMEGARSTVMPQTFAANIFDLYKDSFFLNNGTMGEFATSKVDALLEKLNPKRKDSETEENYQKRLRESWKSIVSDDLKVANLIGDPFLSRYVYRRLEEMGKDADTPEDELCGTITGDEQ